ncbi:MAG: VWA domain-containing protein [Candidatus Hydrogenedentes bacterium]|nr:VWA domain-containing protein [Candidatus Hydrogenedentota bacterium]
MISPASLSFTKFLHPWALLWLGAVVALFAAECAARAPGAMRISTGDTLSRIRGARRAWMRRLPALLRAVGLALLVVALARPVRGLQPRRDVADIIDIMLCVDVSGSMRAMDFVSQGERRDRLFVTKQAVRQFLRNRKQAATDRFGLDRVGLILYAGYAWTQCPLTLDYGMLERELDLAAIDERDPEKRGTAVGSAIGLAVSRLRKSEAKSKVLIVLTDGRNNRGELDPITAAGLAKEFDIRIYTIGAGAEGEALVPRQTLFGEMMVPVNLPIDVESLERIAEETGGRFYRATDTESLEGAYAEINELETTEIELDDYYDYEEGFVPWAVLGGLAMACSILSRRLWFEPIP